MSPGSRSIDLNSDLGEGLGQLPMGDDAALLGIVSSANVACGFHAGDPSTMRRVCELAASSAVVVGAHVAYPDLAGFGRRFIDIDPTELRDAVTYQIGALDAIARSVGTRASYVKPHGALYNTIVHHEAFVERAYNADGTLVSRRLPGAVLHDVGAIVTRTIRMVTEHKVIAIDGTEIHLGFESLCVHGDTAEAVAIAGAGRDGLAAADIALVPFVARTTTTHILSFQPRQSKLVR